MSAGNSIRIPFINNAVLTDARNSNPSLILTRTCDQCLCVAASPYSAVNCFSNNTCQLFPSFPLRWRIEARAQSRLYFPRQSFPDASEPCMPNITYLLNKLMQVNMTSGNVTEPRDIILDNRGALVTVELFTSYLDRFNATNLFRMNHILLAGLQLRAIALNNKLYYAATNNNSMLLVDINTLTVVNNLALPNVNGPRGIIFLNNGQTMVVSSTINNALVFFNQLAATPTVYTFAFYQPVSYPSPHGLLRLNDSFFFATSYANNSIYAHSNAETSGLWTESFIATLPKVNHTGGATRLTVDECGRLWVSLETDTVIILDQQGNQLANYTIANAFIFDIEISDNYLMYFSDRKSNRILRLDPKIQC